MKRMLDLIINLPINAWHYSRKRPQEAFFYGGLVLFASTFAKVTLVVVALVLIIGGLYHEFTS